MAFETILYDVADQILTITLNRPEKLNAYNATMQAELIAAFDQADADDNVRAIIVTGAGRGFCAGADLSAGADTFDRDARRGPVKRLPSGDVDYSDPMVRDGGGQVTLRIFKCLKPVIAAVNGPAVGIGATMQLAMDIRIASEAARFGFVFSQRGIVPEAASSWFLPRLVGISQALEWCYSGRVFPAQEALAGRLVSKVVPPDDLLPTAHALARTFIDKTAPVSVALIRQMMWRMLGADDPMEAHKVDSRGIYARGRSEDVKEGVVAFLEKRCRERSRAPMRLAADRLPKFDIARGCRLDAAAAAGLSLDQTIKSCISDEQRAQQLLGGPMVEIPRTEEGKLHVAGERWRHAQLCQFADVPSARAMGEIAVRTASLPSRVVSAGRALDG